MMTGDEYRKSLNDGRETFFEGRQIDDLPNHPLLGITVNSAASGYDRFYDPAPGAIGAFMAVPGSKAELREQVELHESVDLLTHVTYASIMTLLTAADRIEAVAPGPAARIRTWVRDAQLRDVRIT
ncbi:MAG: 4-hydroxyphenylacetate 3-hydroxylase, partial [Proteobacteria bacterium]|nr:4-hydroxyphenylacetate 3-hydroxylase [Pseudomonadota bacterium]